MLQLGTCCITSLLLDLAYSTLSHWKSPSTILTISPNIASNHIKCVLFCDGFYYVTTSTSLSSMSTSNIGNVMKILWPWSACLPVSSLSLPFTVRPPLHHFCVGVFRFYCSLLFCLVLHTTPLTCMANLYINHGTHQCCQHPDIRNRPFSIFCPINAWIRIIYLVLRHNCSPDNRCHLDFGMH